MLIYDSNVNWTSEEVHKVRQLDDIINLQNIFIYGNIKMITEQELVDAALTPIANCQNMLKLSYNE